MLKDLSGQLMLISAFLLAMMVVAITMMLNNVIYSSNMAYISFIDQSRYDDLSYKQATIKEAIYAEAVDRSNYNAYMQDYAKSLNNITSMRGRYVDLLTYTTSSGPLSNTKTRTELSISGKNSNISYVIYTGYNSQASPGPSPSPTMAFNVTISANKTSMYNDSTDTVKLVITVTDANTSLPASNFVLDIITDRGTSPTAYIYDDGGTNSNPPYLVTDLSGTKIVYYIDKNSTIGTAHIHATAKLNNSSTESYLSNVIEISVTSPSSTNLCSHIINISGTPAIDNIPGKGNDYKITVTFNIGPFSNLNIYPIIDKTSTTIAYDNNPSYNNATKQLTVNVYPERDSNFKLVIKMDITGYCTVDKVNVSRTATLNITGDKHSINASLTYT